MPYLSTLEVCSRQGAIQMHIYLYLYLCNVLPGCDTGAVQPVWCRQDGRFPMAEASGDSSSLQWPHRARCLFSKILIILVIS